MIILPGRPIEPGRYVAFVPCLKAAQNGHYVEPIIAVWANERWHKADPREPVGYMRDAIPPFLVSQFVAQEYDL